MNLKQQWRIIGIIVIVLVLAAGIVLYPHSPQTSTQHISEEEEMPGIVTLTIEGLYANKSVPISRNETLLKVLQKLNATDPQVKLQTKEYSGLGTLVVSMRGWENGTGGKYWQYKVNGVMPQIGAGAYTLKGGDSIEWYFGTSTF